MSSQEARGVAVVTGANTGIGKEVAVGLAAAGLRVILACRDPDRSEQACAEVHPRPEDSRAAQQDLAALGHRLVDVARQLWEVSAALVGIANA